MAWLDIYDRHSTYAYSAETWRTAKEAAKGIMVRNLRDSRIVLMTSGDPVEGLRRIIEFGGPRDPVVDYCLPLLCERRTDARAGASTTEPRRGTAI
jgi:hypothetical protein